MNDLVFAWWSWVAPVSLQVLLLGILVAAADRGLGRHLWPDHRALLWWLVPLRALLPPTWGSPFRIDPIPAAPLPAEDVVTPWMTAVAALWVAGIAVLAGGGIVRFRASLRALLEDSVPAGPALRSRVERLARLAGLRRVPRVVLGPGIPGPAVVGLIRPALLLPADLERRSDSELDHALLHELTHLRRRDPWSSAALVVVQVLGWFHPMIWWAQLRLAALREEACDHRVVQTQGDPLAYRDTLIAFAARMLHGPALGTLPFVRPRAGLAPRLRALDARSDGGRWARRLVAVALILLLAATCLPAVVPMPDMSHLAAEGCLPLRYQVLARMAEAASQTQP